MHASCLSTGSQWWGHVALLLLLPPFAAYAEPSPGSASGSGVGPSGSGSSAGPPAAAVATTPSSGHPTVAAALIMTLTFSAKLNVTSTSGPPALEQVRAGLAAHWGGCLAEIDGGGAGVAGPLSPLSVVAHVVAVPTGPARAARQYNRRQSDPTVTACLYG